MRNHQIETLNVVCTLWQKNNHLSKVYSAAHVNSLNEMLKRETSVPVKLWCVTDQNSADGFDKDIEHVWLPDNANLLPAQFPKLWIFSSDFANEVGWGEKFLYTDLDAIVTGDLSRIVSDDDQIRVLTSYRTLRDAPDFLVRPKYVPEKLFKPKKCSAPINGCLYWYTVGGFRELWDCLDLGSARRIERWDGTEQKWVSYVLGSGVPFWSMRQKYFASLRKLDKSGSAPDSEVVYVRGSHVYKPWDQALRQRNPWLVEKYPFV
jgi:hypothetical protein